MKYVIYFLLFLLVLPVQAQTWWEYRSNDDAAWTEVTNSTGVLWLVKGINDLNGTVDENVLTQCYEFDESSVGSNWVLRSTRITFANEAYAGVKPCGQDIFGWLIVVEGDDYVTTGSKPQAVAFGDGDIIQCGVNALVCVDVHVVEAREDLPTPLPPWRPSVILSFASSESKVVEADGSHSVTVNLNKASGTDLSVSYDLSGTATWRSEYEIANATSTSGILNIPSGSTTTSILVTIVDDDVANTRGNVVLTLRDGTGYELGSQSKYTLTIENDDVAGLEAISTLEVNEGNLTEFDVHLSSEPTSDVTVEIQGRTENKLSLNRTELVFTDANWDDPQTVELTATEDDDGGDETVLLTLSASGGGYDNVEHELTVTVEEDDAAEIVVNPASLEITEEGSSATYTVELGTQPSTEVTVTITGQSGTTLTLDNDGNPNTPFTSMIFRSSGPDAWNIAQTVMVEAASDDNIEEETITLIHTATSADPGYNNLAASLPVNVKDNDMAGLMAPPTLTLTEGSSETFKVQLLSQPSGNVTVEITGQGTSLTLNYDGDSNTPFTGLVFTDANWDDPQTVELTAIEDDDGDDETVLLTLSASGGGYDNVEHELTVTVEDNGLDQRGFEIDPLPLKLVEGSSTTYTVKLASAPTGNVVMAISSPTEDLSASPATLIFSSSNWGGAQIVTLTAVVDEDYLDDEVTITMTASGGGYDGVMLEVPVTITDNLGVSVEETGSPIAVTLLGNYPNPLSDETKIAFDLPAPAQISLVVMDLLGRMVISLPHRRFNAGIGHTMELNTSNLTPGVYYYTLSIDIGDQIIERSRAMTVIR